MEDRNKSDYSRKLYELAAFGYMLYFFFNLITNQNAYDLACYYRQIDSLLK